MAPHVVFILEVLHGIDLCSTTVGSDVTPFLSWVLHWQDLCLTSCSFIFVRSARYPPEPHNGVRLARVWNTVGSSRELPMVHLEFDEFHEFSGIGEGKTPGNPPRERMRGVWPKGGVGRGLESGCAEGFGLGVAWIFPRSTPRDTHDSMTHLICILSVANFPKSKSHR